MKCPATVVVGEQVVRCLDGAGHETKTGHDAYHWGPAKGHYGTERQVSVTVKWLAEIPTGTDRLCHCLCESCERAKRADHR